MGYKFVRSLRKYEFIYRLVLKIESSGPFLKQNGNECIAPC